MRYVWLPDVRRGPEATPVCPECESSSRIGAHVFRENHFARRIYGLDIFYFVMSRRYICHCYAESRAAAKQAAIAAATAAGLDMAGEGAPGGDGGAVAEGSGGAAQAGGGEEDPA